MAHNSAHKACPLLVHATFRCIRDLNLADHALTTNYQEACVLDRDTFCSELLLREGSKRIESFFSEHFFVNQLLARIPAHQVGLDWFYCEIYESYIFIRYFGRDSASTLSVADRKFARVIKQAGFRLALVHYSDAEGFMAGMVDQVMDNYSITVDRKTWQPALDLFLAVSGKPAPAQYKGAANTGPDDKFLATALWSSLRGDDERLVLSRKFVYEVLYTAFHLQPIDIDAIVLCNGAPVCIEFKRKGPAKGKWTTIVENQDIDFSALREYCNSALDDLRARGYCSYHDKLQCVSSKLREAGGARIMAPSFGLDIYPHSRFVRLCEQLEVGYFQINWERPDRRSSNHIDPSDWNFNEPEDFRAAWISPAALSGFNFTVGADSGMNAGLRFQEAVDVDYYRHFPSCSDLGPVFDYLMVEP